MVGLLTGVLAGLLVKGLAKGELLLCMNLLNAAAGEEGEGLLLLEACSPLISGDAERIWGGTPEPGWVETRFGEARRLDSLEIL